MKEFSFRVSACALTLVLLSAFVATSQTANGSLSGMVTDVMGVALPQAKVLLTRTSDRRASFEVRTDDSGQFILKNLPPDTYRVSVTREDSGATTERTISVPKGHTVQLEIRFSTGCDRLSKGSGVSNDDKAMILRTTLRQAATELLDQKQLENGFVLSTQNLSPAWVEGMLDFPFQLMTPAEIQRKADKEGDFQFLSVPEIKVRKQCMVVTVSNTWAKSKDSRTVYMTGGASTYEYRHESGKWVGTLIRRCIL